MVKTNAAVPPTIGSIFVDIDSGDLRNLQKIQQLGENEIARERGMWCDYYYGTAIALIASGLIAEHMLPGQPNRNKVSVTFKSTDERKYGVDYLQIFKRNSHHFRVVKGITKEESDSRAQEKNLNRHINKKAVPNLRPILREETVVNPDRVQYECFEEKILIEAFRKMPIDARDHLIRYVEAITETEPEKCAPHLRLITGDRS